MFHRTKKRSRKSLILRTLNLNANVLFRLLANNFLVVNICRFQTRFNENKTLKSINNSKNIKAMIMIFFKLVSSSFLVMNARVNLPSLLTQAYCHSVNFFFKFKIFMQNSRDGKRYMYLF